MIKQLRLVNWKSHLDSEFNFRQGVNALVGIIGSGKSSVVDAISFALYGTFPAMKSGRVSIDDVIMAWPRQMQSSTVELSFEAGQANYAVKRVIEHGKGTKSAEIRMDGKLLDVGAKNVTEHVSRILSMDYDLFSKAVYSEQNYMDFFLRIPKGQRMGHIDRMLRLELYEKARELSVTLANSYSSKSQALSMLVDEAEFGRLESSIKELESQSSAIRQQIIAERKSLSEVSEKKQGLSGALAGAKKLLGRLLVLRQDLAVAQAVEADVRASIKSLPASQGLDAAKLSKHMEHVLESISSLKKSVESQRHEKEGLAENLFSASARLESLQERQELLAQQLQAAKSAKDKLEGVDAGRLQKNLLSARQQLSELQHEKGHANATLSLLKRGLQDIGQQVCPVCSRQIDISLRATLEEQRKLSLASLEKRQKQIEAGIASCMKQIDSLEVSHELALSLTEQAGSANGLGQALESCESQMKSLSGEVLASAHNLDVLQAGILQNISELESLEKRRETLRDALRELAQHKQLEQKLHQAIQRRLQLQERAGQEEKGVDESLVERLQNELEQASLMENDISLAVSRNNMLLEEKSARLDEMKKRLESMSRQRSEREKFRAISESLSAFSQALSATQVSLREKFVSAVNDAMQFVFGDIYPYDDFDGIRLAVDGDYVLELHKAGSWHNVDGHVSGGERAIACLALRIAFSLAFIPQLRWLILDEPTHNLDSEAIARLNEVFQESISRFASQVFLITHEPEMTKSSAIVYQLDRDKLSGSPTQVTQI